MSQQPPLHFLCLMAATHGLYAQSFLAELKRQGHHVMVLTRTEALSYDWPHESIDAIYAVNNIFDLAELRNAVTYLAREQRIDRLVGPGEYDIELAASLREHLRLPGMGESAARYFRDKLAMRMGARASGVRVPPFVPAVHFPSVAHFLHEVPGPWVVKPRTEASSKGIRKCQHPQEVWDTLHGLGDRVSDYLIERFIPGDVFHVDGIVSGGQVLFAAAHKYGRPILELHTQGGVYTTRRVRHGSETEEALLRMNQEVVTALGLRDGVTHIEYIRSRETGEFYFLEAGARVGAGLIEEMVEAESGLNLWAEWAKIEIAQLQGHYELPPVHNTYAGVLATVAPVEWPDPRPYLQPGVYPVPVPKPYHLGLLAKSDDPDWLAAKLDELAWCVGRDLSVHA